MPWTEPLEELKANVKHVVWWSVGFGIVMTILALIAITMSGVVFYHHSQINKQNIKRNQQTVVALCREINQNNSDLLIVALDLGIPFNKLSFLLPKQCNPAKLRQRYGLIE